MRYQAALHSELFPLILLKKRKDGNNKKKPASPNIFYAPHRRAPIARSHAAPLARVPLRGPTPAGPIVIRSRCGRARCPHRAAAPHGAVRGLASRTHALCYRCRTPLRDPIPRTPLRMRITRAARSLPVGAPDSRPTAIAHVHYSCGAMVVRRDCRIVPNDVTLDPRLLGERFKRHAAQVVLKRNGVTSPAKK